ncbi:hypothetical protein QGM71_13555 [Virgibacillus sp. C22-A2]|uniref:Uncharacterized protein n=1 Tax=Virgibacillus tibetensis TaxID=3042313 RepID=A0ABU6KGT9_9BACI|nr:hypothetical protein [Virgibacillus sp. C22-A2]
MGPYIFITAAVLAVIPILFLYKINMEKLKEDPKQINKVQRNFMIGVAVSEIIPLILLVYGFMNLTPVSGIEELFLPGIILLFLVGYSIFFVLLQKNFDVKPETKATISSFAMVSLPITMAFPIIAFVSLFLMLP